MDRGAGQPAVHGIAESDMTVRFSLFFSLFIYIHTNHFVVHFKLVQYCISTILQKKNSQFSKYF